VIKLQPEEQKAFAQYVYAISSIVLDASKGYLIEGRLASLVLELGCRSYGELLFRAQSDKTGSIRRRIIDAITTGETLFFRDNAPFEMLRHKLLPDLIDRRSRNGDRIPIRIWSAACSTGQEVYSIAIVVKELLGDSERYDLRILGTDISDQAVAHASRAQYSALEISRGMDASTLSKCFKHVGDRWQVRDEIRATASFRTLNLMQDFSALGRFDIIFCRNVAIYFGDPDRVALFGRLARALDRDGSLVVGAMESLVALCPQLEPKRHMRSVYYQSRTTANGVQPVSPQLRALPALTLA
jgi:chemotaxis protein methyltransferase CheR